ncbi:MAG TPA: hypothetical protein VHD91_08005 [Gaiellaceae bacterium]|nr:hypothetical protein [Gaiellaceae bacterium]
MDAQRERLMCRIGLHRWARMRQPDPDLENPQLDAPWVSRCRYCGRERGDASLFLTALFGAVFLGSIAIFWFSSPLLGALVMIAGMSGLMWTAGLAVLQVIVRWLSIGR